jgi:hypothetical protein
MDQHGICPTCKAHCYLPDHKCPPSYLCSTENAPNAEWDRYFAKTSGRAAEQYLQDLDEDQETPPADKEGVRTVYVRPSNSNVVYKHCVSTSLITVYTAFDELAEVDEGVGHE